MNQQEGYGFSTELSLAKITQTSGKDSKLSFSRVQFILCKDNAKKMKYEINNQEIRFLQNFSK